MLDVATGRFTVGVFQDVAWAQKGLEALKSAGLPPDALSIMAKESPDVAKLIGSQTALLAATGIGIGIAGSLALAGFMKALLYGVSPFDPISFGLAAALVGLVAILATVQPARRAMSVDPVTALADR